MDWSFEARDLARVCKGSKDKAQAVLVTLWELGYPNRSLLGEIWQELRIADVPVVHGKTLTEYIQFLDQQP